MGKIILILAVLLTGLATVPTTAYAQNEASSSALVQHPLITASALKIEPVSPSNEVKKATLKAVFKKYNSPFGDEEVDEFMKQCTNLEMNCYLVPAISGVESGFGKQTLANSYNCWGWGGGFIYFNSYKDGIDTVSQSLKSHYINKGATSVDDIGKIYASSGTWSQKVKHFLSIFEEEEKKQLLLVPNAVK